MSWIQIHDPLFRLWLEEAVDVEQAQPKAQLCPNVSIYNPHYSNSWKVNIAENPIAVMGL